MRLYYDPVIQFQWTFFQKFEYVFGDRDPNPISNIQGSYQFAKDSIGVFLLLKITCFNSIANYSIDASPPSVDRYGIFGLKHQQLANFVDTLKNNQSYCLSFRPGSNQNSSISTDNGMTIFSCFGAGGDCPVNMSIEVPNQYCLDAFQKLLPSS